MAGEKFVWCRACREVHHVNAYDKFPSYDGEPRQETARDDWRAFTRRHDGHRLEALDSGEPASWQGGTADPMRERWIEVTNGTERFVIRAFRKSVADPLCFDIVAGRLTVENTALEVQSDAIRKELKKHFPWTVRPPGDKKIELFIQLFEKLVSALAPQTLLVAHDDYREPGVGYAPLTDRIAGDLLRACARYFSVEELNDLERFLRAESRSDGVLALRVRRKYRIENPAVTPSDPHRV
ncbi:MAG TPA: hypothetical protein VNL14_05290 [Candidatus Acidoferrales bacterium]|nr:hypothetical protein [Candidatus Acidoferrales bacterium]